ncbi:MAG: exopolyphosphatase [Nitrospinae bacterium]|nr:exopolyphosphatase [Nitrospinota bacterium]
MRLLTRSDFDGLACAVLLKELGLIDDYKFVHPKDIQDGLVEVTENDVLTNIPYVPGCGMWFDHHASENERLPDKGTFKGDWRETDSAARVIFDYFGGKQAFGKLSVMMDAVDKADAGRFTRDEIMNPSGWVLLSFIMDPRTGLGRFRDYKISNYDLMMKMIGLCRSKTAEEILDDSDVQERVVRYYTQDKLFRDMLEGHTKTDGNVIISDMRGVGEIQPGNRFMIYALFPEQNISIWLIDGRQKQNAVFAVGHSIVNRTSRTNVGSLMLKYGGGGHLRVGTCQVAYDTADRVLAELVNQMKKDG